MRFRNLVEDLNAGIWEMDVPSLKITFVSHQMETILGFPMEKWLQEGDFWVQHVHPEDRGHVVERCRKAIAEGQDYSLRYRAIAANGKTIWLPWDQWEGRQWNRTPGNFLSEVQPVHWDPTGSSLRSTASHGKWSRY